jgi:hypothetical protein
MFDADKPISDKLADDKLITESNNGPLRQERCYSAFRHVAAGITAVASVAPSGHDFATVPAS